MYGWCPRLPLVHPECCNLETLQGFFMLSLHIKGFAFRGFGLLSKDSDEKEVQRKLIGIIQLSLSGIFNDPTL